MKGVERKKNSRCSNHSHHFQKLHVAEDNAQDAFRAAAGQTALQQPAREGIAVAAASVLEFSDLAPLVRVDHLGEAHERDQHHVPLVESRQQESLYIKTVGWVTPETRIGELNSSLRRRESSGSGKFD